jgi:hypothetical protein
MIQALLHVFDRLGDLYDLLQYTTLLFDDGDIFPQLGIGG